MNRRERMAAHKADKAFPEDRAYTQAEARERCKAVLRELMDMYARFNMGEEPPETKLD